MKHFFLLGMIAMVIAILFSACKEQENQPGRKPYEPSTQLDVYKFPLVPGMPAWAELETGEEMTAVAQLPDSVLQVISTAGLVETCYTYTLLLDMLTRTPLQSGVEAIVNIFNGFQELSKREDVASSLMERYEQMVPFCYGGFESETELGDYTLTYALFEAVISQDIYLIKFSKEQKHELLELALDYYAGKKNHSDIYSAFSLKNSAIIMARIMLLEKDPPFLKAIGKDDYLRVFVENIDLQGRFETIDIVVDYAKSFNYL